MGSVLITCINKDAGDHYDPYEAIESLGWLNEHTKKSGTSSRLDMIAYLEQGNTAYTRDRFGGIAMLVVRTSRFGNKYVKTMRNGRDTDNLLELKECRFLV